MNEEPEKRVPDAIFNAIEQRGEPSLVKRYRPDRVEDHTHEPHKLSGYKQKYSRIMARIYHWQYESGFERQAQEDLDALWTESSSLKMLVVEGELRKEEQELKEIIGDAHRSMPKEFSEKYPRYYAYMHFLAGLRQIVPLY